MVLQQLDHVAQSLPELRSAAHLRQHAEEIGVGDPFPGDVGQQVGVVGRLAQDDLGVVGVEVHLRWGGGHIQCEKKGDSRQEIRCFALDVL